VETYGRRAKVKFSNDWQADASRRDFTMNALYCDAAGKIYDFVGGYEDIRRKRIIFVGDPQQRIREDYLRILRFFRFHASYGRGEPYAEGLAACVRLKNGIARLSAERIRQELFRLLVAPGAVATLKTMAKAGILEHILPYTDNWRALGRLPRDPLLRLSVLAAKPAELRDRLRLSTAEARRIEGLLAWIPPSPVLRPREQRILLYQMGPETWQDLVQIAFAQSRDPKGDRRWRRLLSLPKRWQAPAFPVSGKDLIAAGMAPGPEMGRNLRRLEDWWIASDFKPSKDELLARASHVAEGGEDSA
jgi:poly(A) polymerase